MPKKKSVPAKPAAPRAVQPQDSEASKPWRELKKKYPKHASLQEETVYALPVRLLEAIRRRLSRFFTDEELRFERDLADKAGCGFFRGQRFRYPPLEVDETSAGKKTRLDVKVELSTQRIRDMLVDGMLARGVSKLDIQQDEKRSAEERAIVEQWRWAYAGWLATSAEFRRDRDRLRAEMIKLNPIGTLPRMPATLTGNLPSVENPEMFQQLCLPFLQRWSLDSLVTWELPVPLRAELSTPNLYDYSAIRESGVVAFIPWYLLRHRRLKLSAIAERRQRQTVPKGQSEWLSGRDKNWGHERWGQILKLYVHLELVLGGRYREKLKGRLITLEAAFAEYLSNMAKGEKVKEDSVRTLRQKLARRLA